MRGPRKFCQWGHNSDSDFVVDEVGGGGGGRLRIPLKLSAGHHRSTSEMFRWQADSGPKMNAILVALRFSMGSRQVLLRNPIALIFSRWVGDPHPMPPPLGSAHGGGSV